MTFEQARAILDRHCQQLDQKIASSNKKAERHLKSMAVDRSWWFENPGRTPDWRNARTVAYLCAYVEIAGTHIPMQGIRLDDGYMWPDRAVIRPLLQHNSFPFDGNTFFLSP